MQSANEAGIRASVEKRIRKVVVADAADRSVSISCRDGLIAVYLGFPQDAPDYTFRPVLTDRGKVRLRDESKGEDLKLWQASRRALEELFFWGERWR